METQNKQGYKQTEVGLIPEEWEVKKICDVSEVKRGAGSQYITYSDESAGIRFIRINDFFENSPVFIKKTQEILRYIIEKNDILFAGTGNSAGASFLPKDEWIGFPHSYNAPRLRTNPRLSCKEYILYSLKSEVVLRQQNAMFVGAAQPFLDIKAISGFLIPLPPLPEQTAIASALSDMDALIAQTEKLIEKKKAIKQGVMQELLTGKKRLNGFENGKGYKQMEVGVIPEDWEVLSIDSIFDFYSTSNYSKAEMSLEGEVGCIHYGLIHAISDTSYNLQRGIKFFIKPEQAKYEGIKDGDVVMVDASEDMEGVNKSIEVFGVNNKRFIAGLHTYLLRDNKLRLANNFRGAILNSSLIKNQLNRLAVGMKVFGVSKPQLKTVLIPVPPIPEQTAIASALSDMDEDIRIRETKLQKLKLQKQGMMQALLTGKIRLV